MGADGDNHEGQDDVDEVEDSEGVFQDYLCDGISGFLGSTVDLAGFNFGFDLLRGESIMVHGNIIAWIITVGKQSGMGFKQ